MHVPASVLPDESSNYFSLLQPRSGTGTQQTKGRGKGAVSKIFLHTSLKLETGEKKTGLKLAHY